MSHSYLRFACRNLSGFCCCCKAHGLEGAGRLMRKPRSSPSLPEPGRWQRGRGGRRCQRQSVRSVGTDPKSALEHDSTEITCANLVPFAPHRNPLLLNLGSWQPSDFECCFPLPEIFSLPRGWGRGRDCLCAERRAQEIASSAYMPLRRNNALSSAFLPRWLFGFAW